MVLPRDAESPPPNGDLQAISLFEPRVFSLLGAVVAALPFVEKATGVLSGVIRYPAVAATLGTLTSFALIGDSYLRLRPVGLDEIRSSGPLPTGRWLLLTGGLLIAGFVGYSDHLHGDPTTTTALQQVVLLIGYVAIVSCLALGSWQMAVRAYMARAKEQMLRRTP